jgi:hypothetical protein
MKKVVLVSITLLCLTVLKTKAQSSGSAGTYQVGTNVISAGIGLGSSLITGGYGSSTPGISLQYERGVWEAGPGIISLGGYIGYKGYSYSNPDYSSKWNYTIIGFRGAYHLTGIEVENLDVYGGLMLAFDNLSYSETNYNGYAYSGSSYGSGVGLTAFVGAKYYFAGNLGAFAELGYGVSYLSIGLSYKF